MLLAFPFAATLAASRQPVAPTSDRASASTPPRAPPIRTIPAFTPGSPVAAAVADPAGATDRRVMRAAIATALGSLFGPRDRAALLRYVATQFEIPGPGYPFRYDRLEPLLDRALPARLDDRRRAAANDLGALLMVASARYPDCPDCFPGAAQLAFSLLNRARAGGTSCLPQLSLAFLLAADEWAVTRVPRELDAAERACPGDPTPLWLRGQYLSVNAVQWGEGSAPAVAAFHRLQRQFPGSPGGWSGEADTELRSAYQVVPAQPFTARAHFRRALALYRRAERLGGDPDLAAGTARAAAGLGRFREAATAQARALAGGRHAAPLEARDVEYLERGHAFGKAAQAAARLTAEPRFPDGSALYPLGTGGRVDPRVADEDPLGPLSLGAGRLLPVGFSVAPPLPLTDGGGAAVNDLAFVPAFRPVPAVTGYDRWCPSWSYRRDLILAGRPAAALAGMPARFEDIRPDRRGTPCAGAPARGVARLRGLAQLEAGALPRTPVVPFAALQEARQDLWRFAGRLDRARSATEAWMRARPDDVAAATRAGEVAFLARDFDRAAAHFARALRHEWSRTGGITPAEAEARLKLGAALELGGRLAEARAELAASDETASRVLGTARARHLGAGARAHAWFTSYYARLQGGDTELRARRYGAAAELYAAALERRANPFGAFAATPGRRPEVLENNRALVLAQLRLTGPALDAARRAVKADPANPLFRLTEAFALRRSGRLGEAAASYRRAVAEEPRLAPAWNDLGVTLARAGRRAEAAAAFRRALGASSDYAFGWFNLGVALERGGPGDVLAAQGAFARAIRLDADLRVRKHDYVAEDRPYITTLDLSKPIPPRWELSAGEHRTPLAAAGLALALLLGLRLARRLGGGGLGGGDAKRWLELGRELLARLPQVVRFTSAMGAVLATLAVFGWPLVRGGTPAVAGVVLQLAGLGALIAIVMRSRVMAARRAGVELRQRGWLPGIVVGIGAAAFGLAWAPLPVAEAERPAPAVHWIGPVLTGGTALALLVLSALTEVPLTASLGAAALVMTASMLVPVEPLDGGFIAQGTAGLAANFALLAGALFLLLGLS